MQLALKSISVVYKEYLDYQRIQKSEEEQALAQEFKRVYWRESKRKYRSQLSEQEREDAVNVSTPFQIAKARLSSAYFWQQKKNLSIEVLERLSDLVFKSEIWFRFSNLGKPNITDLQEEKNCF